MLLKICVLYISKSYTEEGFQAFNNMNNSLNSNCDAFYCFPKPYRRTSTFRAFNQICYENSFINNDKKTIKIMHFAMNIFQELNDYDYYIFYSDTIEVKQNLSQLINKYCYKNYDFISWKKHIQNLDNLNFSIFSNNSLKYLSKRLTLFKNNNLIIKDVLDILKKENFIVNLDDCILNNINIKLKQEKINSESNNQFYKILNSSYENTEDDEIPLSIVITCENSPDKIKTTLDSIYKNNINTKFEIIIVASSTISETDLKNAVPTKPNIKLITTIFNDYATISNIGCKHSCGELMIFINSGMIVRNDSINWMYDHITKNNADALICNKNFNQFLNEDNLLNWLSEIKDSHITSQRICFAVKRHVYLNLDSFFESYYKFCELNKLILNMYLNNYNVLFSNQKILTEAQNINNNSIINQNNKRIFHAYSTLTKKVSGNITIIIAFKNEKEDLDRTLCSIRATCKNKLPIILVDDDSNDNYNYKKISNFWDCTYIKNKKSIGVAASRDLAVKNTTTKYFVLIDPHNRFYTDNWDEILLKKLEQNQKSIYVTHSIVINKYGKNIYSNEDGTIKPNVAGCRIINEAPGLEFHYAWTYIRHPSSIGKTDYQISCLQCPFYCTNVNWWKHIGGLSGLILWGLDEELMSIKTWLAGGKIILTEDIDVAHTYRTVAPYKRNDNKINSNDLFLHYLFSENPKDKNRYNNSFKKNIGIKNYLISYFWFLKRFPTLRKFKKLFWTSISKFHIDEFWEFNNLCYEHVKLLNIHNNKRKLDIYIKEK